MTQKTTPQLPGNNEQPDIRKETAGIQMTIEPDSGMVMLVVCQLDIDSQSRRVED
jgi:hypothetical protein